MHVILQLNAFERSVRTAAHNFLLSWASFIFQLGTIFLRKAALILTEKITELSTHLLA